MFTSFSMNPSAWDDGHGEARLPHRCTSGLESWHGHGGRGELLRQMLAEPVRSYHGAARGIGARAIAFGNHLPFEGQKHRFLGVLAPLIPCLRCVFRDSVPTSG